MYNLGETRFEDLALKHLHKYYHVFLNTSNPFYNFNNLSYAAIIFVNDLNLNLKINISGFLNKFFKFILSLFYSMDLIFYVFLNFYKI